MRLSSFSKFIYTSLFAFYFTFFLGLTVSTFPLNYFRHSEIDSSMSFLLTIVLTSFFAVSPSPASSITSSILAHDFASVIFKLPHWKLYAHVRK